MDEKKENSFNCGEVQKNWLFADLHIHSRYSRACSKDITIANLVKWARVKGLGLLGTGDFTHNEWLNEIKGVLKEENGIYWYNDSLGKFPFILTSEISLIYTHNGKGRSVHLVYLAPSLEVVNKINSWLDTKGRRDYDGRPIFKISCRDFAAKMEEIDSRIEVIPAHCLLPDSYIHSNKGVKQIKDIKVGDYVLTHKGREKKVKEVMVRDYSGKVYKIIPWYFREGLTTTPEHPFYIIKSFKKCKSTKGTCKPLCSVNNVCRKKHYMDYKSEWVMAKDIKESDFMVYPRYKEVKDVDSIKISDFIDNHKNFNEEFIISEKSRNNKGLIKNKIDLNKDFCRLVGYYLSEGYLIGKAAIGFSFNAKERSYIDEVISLVESVFGFNNYKIDSRRENQADIVFHSKILNSFFRNFYSGNDYRAWDKDIPSKFLLLPKEKLAEIFRGWWRGDTGYTVSKQLTNKMKLICLKLGIIPSLSIDSSEKYNKRGNHFVGDREIISVRDLFIFSNLSFFENDYGMLKEKCFKKSINKINRKHGWMDENYIYLPVRKIEINNYDGEVYNLEVEEDNSYVSEYACVHNCWTPYFGVFGSESGFDSLTEAFGDKTYLIHAIETGISSDPAMNWKIKDLNNISILSFSDSHSYWPFRIGREASIFSLDNNGKISYDGIIKQIRENSYIGTIETDPAYGKYHYDGHLKCNFSCSYEETNKLNGKCPVCGKSLIVGVEYRVDALSKNGEAEHSNKKCFYSILPLHEIISLAIGIGINSKGTWKIYNELIEKFGNEFNILLSVKKENLEEVTKNKLLVDLIIRNREGRIQVKPGYDGAYGVAILEKGDNREVKEVKEKINVKEKKENALKKIEVNILPDNYKGVGNFKYEKQKRLF